MPDWQKSSYCGQGESCVHVAADDATVLLMESADPSGAVLRMPQNEFADLLADIKAGAPAPTAPDGTVRLGPVTTTTERWHAFQEGVRHGEFDHFAGTPHATVA
ncbi:DUF397 domain-containing protein [Streptomyces sp. YC504]|uniref:DUF397 domain-containing protein n=1 Tax=Streptomyces mesophilus TaxID=1775132 RepID=A0A6G4XTC9_9ACTN|nr:DUF397 domain-containing protein [Streptomyces mesophilus]NGO79861.1 DUF397 domain-containing protein [Streptomyces mesophilus]